MEEVGGSIPPCPRFVFFPFSFLLLFFPSPLLFSFLLLSSIPPCPRFVFLVWFLCLCVWWGGVVVWCVVWVWFAFGLGVMVFDVGVVWMGGSVLGPVWVRVCLAVCAFVRFPIVFWWGVVRVIDKKTRRRHARRERCEHRARGSCLHAAWACARCTPIYSRRSTLPTRTLRFAPAQGE